MAEIGISEVINSIDNNGYFDVLMESIDAKLDTQFKLNRIKGTDYANVYLGALQFAIQQSIQFALNKQQSDKQAELLQQQIDSLVAELAIKEAQSTKDLELKTQQIASMVIEDNIKQDQSTQELINKDSERELTEARTQTEAENKELVIKQQVKSESENDLVRAQITKVDKEVLQIEANTSLIEAKIVTEDAQTTDLATGVIGKQQTLYTNQANSFTRRAEIEAVNAITDIWKIAKSSGTDVYIPSIATPDVNGLGNINTVLTKALNNAGITTS